MILLAVSGGPDSMLMLDDYKKKNIVVAHVNYHKRKDSNVDEEIVKEFCKSNKIPFEILSVKEESQKNFQDWARDIRYKFFKEVYDKYGCNNLYFAHHKDDFIETALMQQNSKRTPRHFGILQKNYLYGMNIYRPFVKKYFKDEILKICKNENISYAIDSSNKELIFERNKIRYDLSKKSKKEKVDIYQWFKMSNKILKKKFSKIDFLYKKWKKTNFKLEFIRFIKKYREEIIFEYIYDNFKKIKLSSSKIKSILNFIDGREGKKAFVLDDNNSLSKENKYLKATKGKEI